MFTNRFISLLVAISLLAVTVLVVRNANATASLVANVDSATHSYTAWAKAEDPERNAMDSATRSYSASAREVACGVDPTYRLALDSATRSYVALAKETEIGEWCR